MQERQRVCGSPRGQQDSPRTRSCRSCGWGCSSPRWSLASAARTAAAATAPTGSTASGSYSPATAGSTTASPPAARRPRRHVGALAAAAGNCPPRRRGLPKCKSNLSAASICACAYCVVMSAEAQKRPTQFRKKLCTTETEIPFRLLCTHHPLPRPTRPQ